MSRYSRVPGLVISEGLPVCDASNMTFFGTNLSLPGNQREHLAYLFDNNFNMSSSSTVAVDHAAYARKTLALIDDQVDQIVVNLDVDSIDPRTFPHANVPNFTGVDFEQMMVALRIFLTSNKVVALVTAECNPDHDPSLALTTKLTDEVVAMLVKRLSVKL